MVLKMNKPKFMEKIMYKVFGIPPKNQNKLSGNSVFHVTGTQLISFEQWCKEFKVSMLYDRKIPHM